METPPRRPYVSPPPHPTNTTRPLPPLARCLFYHPPAPLLEPPFRESTRNSYRSADEFEVLRILRGVLLTTGSSLSLSPLSFSLSPLLFLSFSFSLDFHLAPSSPIRFDSSAWLLSVFSVLVVLISGARSTLLPFRRAPPFLPLRELSGIARYWISPRLLGPCFLHVCSTRSISRSSPRNVVECCRDVYESNSFRSIVDRDASLLYRILIVERVNYAKYSLIETVAFLI